MGLWELPRQTIENQPNILLTKPVSQNDKIIAMKLAPILRHVMRVGPIVLLAVLILSSSTIPPGNQIQRARAYTRDIEFDFVSWAFDALSDKVNQSSLGTSNYLASNDRYQIVVDHMDLVSNIQELEWQLRMIYGDPSIEDPQAASEAVRNELDDLREQRERIAPVAEEILQNQLSTVAAVMGLAPAGQPIPPVLYHSTSLPWSLIISPRDKIAQIASINLITDLSVDQHVTLEEQVDQGGDVSSLVVGIGGIGLYPTMISHTSNLTWLSEVIAHEWVHNILSLRPLGINYLTSPELRIMNETAASIAGKEIGLALLERYYPEFVPPPPQPAPPPSSSESAPDPPAFDFRAEMRETRVTVDELLAGGRIEEAEDYMEGRRQFFWENGYRIRKLNQAYFAFHGAYADVPGGAAGEDPVGAAVRELRAQSPSLATFLNRISWMSSFEQLLSAIEQP